MGRTLHTSSAPHPLYVGLRGSEVGTSGPPVLRDLPLARPSLQARSWPCRMQYYSATGTPRQPRHIAPPPELDPPIYPRHLRGNWRRLARRRRCLGGGALAKGAGGRALGELRGQRARPCMLHSRAANLRATQPAPGRFSWRLTRRSPRSGPKPGYRAMHLVARGASTNFPINCQSKRHVFVSHSVFYQRSVVAGATGADFSRGNRFVSPGSLKSASSRQVFACGTELRPTSTLYRRCRNSCRTLRTSARRTSGRPLGIAQTS